MGELLKLDGLLLLDIDRLVVLLPALRDPACKALPHLLLGQSMRLLRGEANLPFTVFLTRRLENHQSFPVSFARCLQALKRLCVQVIVQGLE